MTMTIDLGKRFSDHWRNQPRDEAGRWTDRPLNSTPVGRAIAEAFTAITQGRSAPGWEDTAHISDIRDRIGDRFSRDEVDAELRRIGRAAAAGGDRGVMLVPQSNQKTLTEQQRAGGVPMGGEVKHLIQIHGAIKTPGAAKPARPLKGTPRPDPAQLARELGSLPVDETSRDTVRERIQALTVAELRRLTTELRIPGRSKARRKDQLRETIEAHTVGNALDARSRADELEPEPEAPVSRADRINRLTAAMRTAAPAERRRLAEERRQLAAEAMGKPAPATEVDLFGGGQREFDPGPDRTPPPPPPREPTPMQSDLFGVDSDQMFGQSDVFSQLGISPSAGPRR